MDIFVFLGKFFWKLTRLTGVPAVVQSRPVKFVWSRLAGLAHSPPLSWGRKWWVVMAAGGMVVGGIILPTSDFDKAKLMVVNSPTDQRVHLRLAEAAARASDFELARKEFVLANSLSELVNQVNQVNQSTLGLSSEVEEVRRIVFPEEVIGEEIKTWEELLKQKPGYRDVLLRLAVLYWRLGQDETAKEYFEQAKILDPNNEMVQEVKSVISDQ